LRSKLYAFATDNHEEKRAKGISKSVVKQTLNVEDYKSVLFNKSTIHRKMQTINSEKHCVYTNEINKVALCGKDDKRYIMKNNIDTLALGHYKIK